MKVNETILLKEQRVYGRIKLFLEDRTSSFKKEFEFSPHDQNQIAKNLKECPLEESYAICATGLYAGIFDKPRTHIDIECDDYPVVLQLKLKRGKILDRLVYDTVVWVGEENGGWLTVAENKHFIRKKKAENILKSYDAI